MSGRDIRVPVISIGLTRKGSRVMADSPGDAVAAENPGEKLGGLVLTRHLGQSIMIGDSVEVEVVAIKSGTARIRIAAPRDVSVHRREVYEAIQSDPRPVAPPRPPDREASYEPSLAPRGQGGLVLTRHPGESIMIGDRIAVEVVDIRPSAVRIRIAAPREVSVHRREIYDAIRDKS